MSLPDISHRFLFTSGNRGSHFFKESSGELGVPGQVMIVAGDDIRVGEGMATFTATGQRGSFAIFPQSELVFSSDPRFAAELRGGRVGMRSSNGPSAVVLRAGNFVIVASAQGQESAATVERQADNSYLITCTEGSIGIVPLGGGNGLFLQAGQSARITAGGQLVAVTPASTTTPPPSLKKGSLLWLWLLLGAGGGGGLPPASRNSAKAAP